MTSDDLLVTTLRLVLAALVGAAIGLNRDLHRKPAGIRTHALVSLGTALMVIVVLPPGSREAPHYDALSRVIQGVLTGIGFLGAGVILRDPGTRHVSGLTTAATVWLTALLGVACGAGLYVPVMIALAIGGLVIAFGGRLERALRPRWTPKTRSDADGEPPDD